MKSVLITGIICLTIYGLAKPTRSRHVNRKHRRFVPRRAIRAMSQAAEKAKTTIQ